MSASVGADLVVGTQERRFLRLRALDRAGALLTLVAFLGAILWAFPIYFSIYETLKPGSEAATFGDWLADVARLYGRVIFETNLGRWYLNSIVTSLGVAVGVILISATCGYAISQIRFRGRRTLWFLILASFMIPIQALIVSHFFLMYNFGLINTWLGVILPQLIAPVAVIIYKQFFDSVPREFREAAMIDGASHAQILFRIFLPTNWGVTAALAIITFIGAWNAFLWPFLAVTTEPMMNVAVAMGANFTALGENYLAASLLAGLPVAVVYLLFQRRVTQAVVLSAGVSSK
jgi:multiple sugar transport system permease protein